MFGKKTDQGYTELIDGIRIKTVVYGNKSLMSEFLLREGCELPLHSHPQEQTGYLVSGKIRLYIGSTSRELMSGDSWNIPESIPHRAEILEDSIAIEVFTPSREEYIQYTYTADLFE